MIKFRKGGPFVQAGATDSGAAAEEVQTGSVVSKSEALEWWMTPERFKRREIDELECEIINVGRLISKLELPLYSGSLSLFSDGWSRQAF